MSATVRLGISQGHGGATVVAGARTFAAALSARTGRTIRVHVAEDYPSLLKSLVSGGIELGWMPPFLVAHAAEQGSTLCAVCERHGELTYRSAVVVPKDGKLRTLDDLVGVRAAWVDRQSASGYVFPRLHLVAAGVDPTRAFASETFYGSPRAALSAVADGQADLCGCFTSEEHATSYELTLGDVARIYPAAYWRLRVLRITDAIPSDGLVTGPHVDADTRETLIAGLCALHTFVDGKKALDQLLFADKLVAVDVRVERLVAKIRTLLPLMR